MPCSGRLVCTKLGCFRGTNRGFGCCSIAELGPGGAQKSSPTYAHLDTPTPTPPSTHPPTLWMTRMSTFGRHAHRFAHTTDTRSRNTHMRMHPWQGCCAAWTFGYHSRRGYAWHASHAKAWANALYVFEKGRSCSLWQLWVT